MQSDHPRLRACREVDGKVTRRLAFLAMLLVGTGSPGEPVHAAGMMIRAWPSTSFEPANLRVEVLIERRAENRRIRISADSQGYFSSSEAPLEGEHSARFRVVTFRDLPAGVYELRVEVFGDQGRLVDAARTGAIVIGR